MALRENLLDAGRWFIGLAPKEVVAHNPNRRLSVTAIVPAYNEEASIALTIESLQNQTYPIDTIIVADDCSSDRTGEIARTMGAVVYRTPKNQGTKAQAQNYVLQFIETDLFVTVDADTTLAPNAIEKTLRYFDDPKTLIVSGFVIPKKINTLWERGRFIEYLFGLTIIKPAQNHNRITLVASGCFSIFRTKETMREFGRFDERTMAEDMDLTWDATARGYHVYFAPEACCYPIDPPTFKVYKNQIERWYRGFLQNISVRKFYKFGNWRLQTLIYAYLVWFLIGPLMLPFTLWWILGNVPDALLWTIGLQAVMTWLPSVWRARRYGMTWLAITSLPAFIVTQYVCIAMYMQAVWNEWILRKPLLDWNKGH